MRTFIKKKIITDKSDEVFNMYLKDISKIPLLTEEEELKLYPKLVEQDKSTIDKFIVSNLRFVVTVAKQYQNQGLLLNDLIENGNIGLIKATRHFDPTKGVKFLSYATWWIRESIIFAINNTSKMIRIPNATRILLNKINKIQNSYYKEFGREPSFEELLDATGIQEDILTKLLDNKIHCFSVEKGVDNSTNESLNLLNVIPSEEDTIEDKLIQKETLSIINRILSQMPVRDSTIVKMYHGLCCRQMNLDDIGKKFGLTAERVRQIKDNAINFIKKNIREYE